MIKRIIGYIITIAVVAIIVMTALNYGSYKSLLPEDLFSASPAQGATDGAVSDDATSSNQ